MNPRLPAQFRLIAACFSLTLLFGVSADRASGKEGVDILVDPRQPGPAIPRDFAGLSFEAAQLLPDGNGHHYFSADNASLVTLFRTLGIKSVRIGGNSVDAPRYAVPGEADITSFFEFAKAAGVKVIYSVRLEEGDPQSAARIAAFIHDHFYDTLECFAIGNEPDYYKAYDVFRAKWSGIMDAMIAAVPDAKFCGPDQNPNPAMFKKIVRDFAQSGRLVMLTEHSYPGGCSYKNPGASVPVSELIPNDPALAREKLLSPELYAVYEEARRGVADAAAGTSLPWRLDETNSFWYGGLKGASDSYAAALWSLDYLYWWAAHGARGLNFHTGEHVGGDKSVPSRYAAFLTSGHGYDVRPMGYGMKMFDLGSRGELIQAAVSGADGRDLSVYATRQPDGSVAVTLINKAHGSGARRSTVRISWPSASGLADAAGIYLAGPAGDIAATQGLTIGGASILDDGSWQGRWKPLRIVGGNSVALELLPASAAVVEVHPR